MPRILPIILLLYLGSMAGRFVWWDSSIASGSEVLMISLKNDFPKIHTGERVIFIGVELYSSVCEVPCPLNQFLKMCSWGSNRAKSRACVQSFLSMVEWGPM